MSGTPELLAPAGSMEALTAALRCGADAVYAGAKRFSARASAENFDDAGLCEAARLCHLYGARLYLAVNTLIFDDEFSALDALAETIAAAGIDGCIMQDLGAAAYLAKRLPTLRLHASTQLTIHTPAGVQFAKQAGFCRAVAARELSRTQLAALCEAGRRYGVEIEAFVHGAHCMSVSGQCYLSAAMGGRSANRGCCAQPCRLPFTADPAQRGACALSLKDMSLVRQLHEMAEMGVASLKIEGRMKRPEYVAAAVTACRAALDGGEPDLDMLRAVFSRSGFTDGYFTGARKEMFGTRQKDDVVAAQEVLAPLRTSYRKPRQVAGLQAHFVVRAGQPVTLTVTEGSRAVTVAGGIPLQAEHRATDLTQLTRQFEKLGSTVYTCAGVTADLEDGLMVPASALNALRRKAIEEMDEWRIADHTVQHTLAPRPEPPKRAQQSGQTAYRLQIREIAQLDGLAGLADGLEALLLPLQLAARYAAEPRVIPLQRVMLLTPRFVTDEAAVIRMLQEARALGYEALACQNVGDIVLGQTLGFRLHGGFGLHCANGYAAEALRQHGLQDILWSPETGHTAGGGVYAYGRLPVMLVRNCPVQAQVGCAKCRHRLTDRKGMELYTDCTRVLERPDYAEVFNAVPVWQGDRRQSGAAYGLLNMTDETVARTAEIVRAYLLGEAAAPPAAYTRGLRLQKPQQTAK